MMINVDQESLPGASMADTTVARNSGPLGILAGNGGFPVEAARVARAQGRRVIIAAHRGEFDPALVELADELTWVSVGAVSKVIKFFRRHSVHQVVVLGGINKRNLIKNFRPDWRGVRALANTFTRADDAVLSALLREFERDGFEVIAPMELLPESVPEAGVLGDRDLTSEELFNAQLAWRAAKAIGALDIGQGAIAARTVVLALEAVEGTDALIERAVSLNGRGAVLVKVCKPQQDQRIDLPTVGPLTIAALAKGELGALVIEAGRTMILDPVATVRAANRAGIAFVAVNWDCPGNVDCS